MKTQTIGNSVQTRNRFESVDGLNIFYRESGVAQKRAIVLLHGYPTSSHMYRELLTALGDDYYLLAPDYPGFGNSDFPAAEDYQYTFDNFANTIDKFLQQKGVAEFVLVMQDYGAPVGFRLATRHPERVKGLILMNGNAYEEGFHPENTAHVRDFWDGRTPEKERMIANALMSFEGIKWQYTEGTRNPQGIDPDNWILDFARISRPGQQQVQLDLFYDYRNNIKQYPQWQAFLREHQPPTLIAWGANDPIFPAAGAEAYRKDLNNIDFHLFESGHFVLEEFAPEIISTMRNFLSRIGQ